MWGSKLDPACRYFLECGVAEILVQSYRNMRQTRKKAHVLTGYHQGNIVATSIFDRMRLPGTSEVNISRVWIRVIAVYKKRVATEM